MKKCIPMLLLTAVVAGSVLPAQAQEQPPVQPTPQVETQTPDIPTTAQRFVTLLAEGNFDATIDLYDGDAAANRSTIRQTWQDITAINGALRQQTGTRTLPLENPEGGTLAIVTVQFENATRELYIVFNSGGKIVSLDVVDAAER